MCADSDNGNPETFDPNMYTQSITRTHRTAFILLIDGSGSMCERIRYGGCTMTKSEAVTEITNGLLFELIERARRNDGIRDYYDIAVLGYSGDDEVYSLLPGGRTMIPVTELAALEPRMVRRTIECLQPDGNIALREVSTPVWVEAEAAGQTPMCEALRQARDLAAAWCAHPAHAESFPPTIFNITDGEATDCTDDDLIATSEQIKALGTADGAVLLVNIHITADETSRTVFFPSEEETNLPNRYASTLFRCASIMPEVFDDAIREIKGPGAIPPFRGMSYNASADELIAMLNIGSISVKTE